MFLKSLVIRGFKSFADKTTLAFEPGISVVVGPNGSGKSNVIDAISWVLGEQGPATLRGGKMEDVIFAGSATRPPLGMAEVQLTIDNTAGLLPVEFSEVTISRTLFRSGDSEYRMNGSVCRLLDISEMLSDAGVGREQHTIVGQGRLDEVLSADPVQMRSIIEDAAGVGKHRRRKERALRKMASTEQNLDHLADLLAEIRRQLKPLRQQAEIAERHERMRGELQRIKLVAAARQLAALEAELGSPEAGRREEELKAREDEVGQLQAELAALETERLEALAGINATRETAWRLAGAAERLGGLKRLAGERARTLRAELAAGSEDVEQARLLELQRQQSELEVALAEAQRHEAAEVAALNEVQPAGDAARDALSAAERSLNSALQGSAQAAAETAALRRSLSEVQAAAQVAEMERKRLAERAEQADLRRRTCASRLAAAELELDLAGARLGAAEVEVREAEGRLEELSHLKERLVEEIRHLEKQVAVLRSRAAARAAAEARRTPAGAAVVPLPGTVLLSELVDLDEPHRRALEALIGPIDGVVVAFDADTAWQALRQSDEDDPVTVLLAGGSAAPIEGAQPLADRLGISAPDSRAALAGFFYAGDGRNALRLAQQHRHAVFLSGDGTVVHGGLATRGSAEITSAIVENEARIGTAREALAGLEAEIASARAKLKEAAAGRREAETARVRAAEHLRTCQSEMRRAEDELAAIGRAAERFRVPQPSMERSEELERRLDQAEAAAWEADAALETARGERERCAEAYERAAQASEAARMNAGIAAERTRQHLNRLKQVVKGISDAASRLSGLGARHEALLRAQKQVASLAAVCEVLAGPVAEWAGEAGREHLRAAEAGAVLDGRTAALKQRLAEASEELDRLRALSRQEDLGRSECRIRQRILQATLAEEMQVDPSAAVERWGRRLELPEGETPADPMERAASMPDDVLKKRQVRLERELEQLGSVNPLAAREAEALAEREEFLAGQMEDVRESRKDLRQVVTSVDEKIRELFTAAFADIAREYEHLFSILFPAGKGRLRLTDPTEVLESGVEVEASPSGKSLKRLSLLSGGERAMAALALLFAIFKSRPSPFYILDEVEAALDDVNLQRFLGLLEDFRGSSQLLVVTHQKKTMEIADVLYGVAMRPDGVTKVISERLTDFFPASVSSPGSGIGVDLE
ncbi:MAG TPA: chromosome segregation protein SMC [Actinomycetota bacterium]|nr:chromosome segregation protein SMC [Actinomycetota bacterium]